MCDCQCDNIVTIGRLEKEVSYWRAWYTRSRSITNSIVLSLFLYMPGEDMIRKSPDENLIECLHAALDKLKK